MPFTLTMPKLSPTMETGTIAKWHKKEGDYVEAGELLIEVSTDKATVEHNALDEGYLRKIIVKDGGEASVNQPIAIFTEKKDENLNGYKAEGEAPAKKEEVKTAKPAVQEKNPASDSGRIVASPLAKKLAEQKGIDLSKLSGTGPRGRIVSKDLEQKTKSYAPAGEYEEVSLSQMRKVISQRLQEAKSTIPHFYVEVSINAEPLVNFREQLKTLDVKISINDCIVKAVALTLKKHPNVNAGFNAKSLSIIQYKTIDVSVAVSIEGGLITPIITHADQKSLKEISAEVKVLAQKAKEGKLAPKEFQGGGFTVSNLGMYNVTRFQGIINPPQAALLAVGGILEQPVVRNGAVVPGKVMNLTLSSDHRVVDGVAAAEFLKTLKDYLENPLSLLL